MLSCVGSLGLSVALSIRLVSGHLLCLLGWMAAKKGVNLTQLISLPSL